ncbi:TOPRIM nucleotidyl transferase/hydrolase domain-containing protein [Streptomyces narbonensis]|uniref:TOPRIM nucleotidyl transferase/hydrolase domain-containing protein n=1 Tax=Streptomyces narbonensis TaxID=67333 RepID=A0ABV3C1S7_9ACTN
MEVFQHAGRNGADTYSVRVDLELDQPWEQELVRLFVEAAVCTTALELVDNEQRSERKAELALFTEHGVLADSVTSLLRGTLSISYSARHPTRWWAAWDFTHEGKPYQLTLKGPTADMLYQGPFPPWMDAFTRLLRGSITLLSPTVGSLKPFIRIQQSVEDNGPEPAVNFGAMISTLDASQAYSMTTRTLTNGNAAEPRSLIALDAYLGYGRGDRRRLSFGCILAEVLRRQLVLTNNRRLPLERLFPMDALGTTVDLRNGSAVAAELYRLKNGTPFEQERFEKIREVFADITRLDLRIQSRPATGTQDAYGLAIDILVCEPNGTPRIAQLAGAGIQEALLLATLLAGEPGRVVVLDEPAVNLHPTMQRRLVRHLGEVQGIVITHSPDLVPCANLDDLDHIVRLSPNSGGTTTASLADEHKGQMERWMKNLLISDVRALLFASGVILCEGATELGALSRWWRDAPSDLGDPEGSNITMIEVGGHKSFGGYINYLDAFGIPWAVVADGPALAPNSDLRKQLARLGAAGAEPPGDNTDFAAWRAWWSSVGVFTLANTFGTGGDKAGEIEAFLGRLDSQLWQTVCAEQDGKPRRGAAFAAACQPTPEEVEALYRGIRKHLHGRNA